MNIIWLALIVPGSFGIGILTGAFIMRAMTIAVIDEAAKAGGRDGTA